MNRLNDRLKLLLDDRVPASAARPGRSRRPYWERRRLHQLLIEALEYPLLLVTAGAGYGKTQTVYSVLRDYPATTTWVQLSERDNQGYRFWDNFRYALSLSNPSMAEMIKESNFPASESQIEFFLDIFSHEQPLNKKHILVFDDLHLIHRPKVLRFIEKLIYAFLPGTTVIIISRTQPNIKTVGLLAKNLLYQVDESDLRFSKDEIREYLRVQGLDPSPLILARINRNTEGWALAVNLAGASLRQAPGQEAQALSALKLNIFKLIEDDIFSGLSPELRRWLVKFSLIEHLSAELIRRLDFPGRLRAELDKIGAFIRYDAFLDTFHIHQLLRDYLIQKQAGLNEEERREVHLRAAEWCAENNYKIDAISYFEKAGEYRQIIDLVDSLTLVVPLDMTEFVLDIFDRAPPGTFEPLVNYPAMRTRLLISAGRLAEVRTLIAEIIEEYSQRPANPFNNRVLCGAYNCLGIVKLFYSTRDEPEDFPHCFEKADYYYSLTPFTLEFRTSLDLGIYACMINSPQEAHLADYLDRLGRAVGHISNSHNGYMYGLDDLARGELAYFQADFKKARVLARQAFNKAREKAQFDIANRSLFYLLRLAVAEGRHQDIQEVLDILATQLDQPGYYFREVTYDMATSWYYLSIGQFKMVANWLKIEFQPRSFNFPLAAFSNLLKARLCYHCQKYTDVLAIAGSDSQIERWLFGRLEMKVMKAGCLYHLDQKDQALEALREAYELSRPNRLDMPFIELGRDMRNLSAAALKTGDGYLPRDWLERINRKAAGYSRKIAAVSSEYQREHNLDRTASVTDKELKILADLYNGLSRSEMAAAHGLSINTVKSRLNMLYAKLGAENRVDAIRLALEKNLLQ